MTTLMADTRPDLSPWMRRLCERVKRCRSQLDFDDGAQGLPVDRRLLRATLEQMLDRPFRIIAKGVMTSHFDEIESGLRSRATRRFGNAAGLTLYALTEAIQPHRSQMTDVLIDSALQALIDPAVRHEDVVLELGHAYFNAVCDDPSLTFQTFAWLGARESVELRDSFAKLYASLDYRVADGLDLFLEAWGRRPCPGMTSVEIGTVLASTIEGLAMRTAVYPDSVRESLAAEAALALMVGFTEPCPAGRRPASCS